MADWLPPGYDLADPPPAAQFPPSGYTAAEVPQSPRTLAELNRTAGMSALNADNPAQSFQPTPQMGSIVRGGRDVVDTWAQRLARAVETIAPNGSLGNIATELRQDTENVNRTAEEDYRKNWRPDLYGNPTGQVSDPWRTAGNIGANIAITRGLPTGVLGNTIGGSLYAERPNLEPNLSNADYWKGQATDAGLNGISAAGTSYLTGLISRAFKGATRPEVKDLLSQDVNPTIGQIFGGAANRVEQALESVPVLGDLVKGGRAGANREFDIAVANHVLAPISEKLDASKMGRDAIDEIGNKVSSAYNAAVPQAGGILDQQAHQDLSNLVNLSQYMPPDRAKQFQEILQGKIFDKIAPNGGMTGESFKEAESDLGKMASGYLRGNNTSDERQLGGAIREAQSTLREWLQRVNPTSAEDIANANQSYARMLRLENASARANAEPGAFSPAQLQAAVKKYGGERAYARGNALMQPLADAGRSVLGATLPDSGTPFRSAAMLMGAPLLGALGGHELASPQAVGWGLGLAGAAGLGAGLYSPTGRALAARALVGAAPATQNLLPYLPRAMPGALGGF